MPEGDTIFALAERLRPILLGTVLEDVWLREVSGATALEGGTVLSVEARGKHLLIETQAGGRPAHVLRTHLGMNGGWRTLYERTQRNPGVRVAFRAGPLGPELRCHEAAQVEVLFKTDLHRHPALARLGPDLLANPNLDVVVKRARDRDRAGRINDLSGMLLDQQVAAGLGNVYKSELLFRAKLHPWWPIRVLTDEALRELYRDGASLLSANRLRRRRVTTLGPMGASARVNGIDHFVYNRAGRRCIVCGSAVWVRRQGEGARPTFWCAQCQPKERATSASSGRGVNC